MKRLNIKKLIILILLLVGLIPLNVAVISTTMLNIKDTRANEISLLELTTGAISDSIDSYFHEKKRYIDVYANDYRVKSMKWNLLGNYLQDEVRRTKSFDKMIISFPDGTYYNTASGGNAARGNLETSNNKDSNAALRNLSKRDYWQKTLGKGASKSKPDYVSDLMISKSTAKMQIMVAQAVYDGSSRKGMLGGTIAYEEFAKLKEQLFNKLRGYFNDQAGMFVLTQTGKFLYHEDKNYIMHLEDDGKGGKKVIAPTFFDFNNDQITELGQKALRGESGHALFDDRVTGKSTYYFYSPIKSTGYSVIVTLPESYVMRNVTKSIYMSLSISVVFIILIIIFAWSFSSKISRPVTELNEKFDMLSDGDLTARVNAGNENSKFELDILSNNFNFVMSKLQSVLSKVVEVSQSLASSSIQMNRTIDSFADNIQTEASSVEEVNATLEELAASEDNILMSTEFQQESFDKLNSRADDLKDIIENVGRNIQNAVEKTGIITSQAKSSEDEMNQMVSIMSRTYEGSKDMLNIIKIINDISEQINLLSLNAAIEAARAGDAGRGFAVVADEIGHLADETTTSLKQIDSLIKQNNSNINIGLDKVQAAISNVNLILGGIESTNEMIKEISSLTDRQVSTNDQVNLGMSEVYEKSDLIANTIKEGKIAIDEIVKSITGINDMTQHNASGAEELSASSEEISTMAELLKEEVDFFKLS